MRGVSMTKDKLTGQRILPIYCRLYDTHQTSNT